jgi:hypothetical protein
MLNWLNSTSDGLNYPISVTLKTSHYSLLFVNNSSIDKNSEDNNSNYIDNNSDVFVTTIYGSPYFLHTDR